MDSSFFLSFPRYIDSAIAGPEGAKILAGVNVLRLIQIRLTTLSFEKIAFSCQDKNVREPGLGLISMTVITNQVCFLDHEG